MSYEAYFVSKCCKMKVNFKNPRKVWENILSCFTKISKPWKRLVPTICSWANLAARLWQYFRPICGTTCYFSEKFIFGNLKITFPTLKSLHKYWRWGWLSFRIYFITWFICDVIYPENTDISLGLITKWALLQRPFFPETCHFNKTKL